MLGSAITTPPAIKPVYVLPRLRLSTGVYGRKEVRVGKAEFWPDEEATWADVVGKPRPPWLDIFRDFPAAEGEEPDWWSTGERRRRG